MQSLRIQFRNPAGLAPFRTVLGRSANTSMAPMELAEEMIPVAVVRSPAPAAGGGGPGRKRALTSRRSSHRRVRRRFVTLPCTANRLVCGRYAAASSTTRSYYGHSYQLDIYSPSVSGIHIASYICQSKELIAPPAMAHLRNSSIPKTSSSL